MKGLELSKAFFEEYGMPMLKAEFPELLPLIAVGFTGSGSERYGFDDEISKDHDYEVGFTIFLPSEESVDARQEFRLERAYSKLPKEYMGVKRQPLSPVGGNRNGPVRIAEFYKKQLGNESGDLTIREWLTLPDYALRECVNGEIFYDGLGKVTEIRENLKNVPEDGRKKRLAGNLLIMAQSGQYNLPRCIKRGDVEAACLTVYEFVNSAIKTLFLLKGEFAPYYKWSFHALKKIYDKEITDKLSKVLTKSAQTTDELKEKYYIVEEICSFVTTVLTEQNLTKAVCGDLEKHAYSVNDKIVDGAIRNLNVLVSV